MKKRKTITLSDEAASYFDVVGNASGLVERLLTAHRRLLMLAGEAWAGSGHSVSQLATVGLMDWAQGASELSWAEYALRYNRLAGAMGATVEELHALDALRNEALLGNALAVRLLHPQLKLELVEDNADDQGDEHDAEAEYCRTSHTFPR